MSVFQVGDRVRLKAGRHHAGYRQGDTGTITAVMPSTTSSGGELYEVNMDRNTSTLHSAFYTDELELEK
jgi:hypothetical protein